MLSQINLNSNPKSIYLILFFIFSVIVLIYYPGLSGPFLLDDYNNLSELIDVTDTPLTVNSFISSNQSGPLGRPISMLSFYFDYQLWGSQNDTFKQTNLFIHLVCGLLIFVLSRQLLEQSKTIKNSIVLALMISALWLTTPIHVSTVLYTVQRMTQLSTLFVLSGCINYIYFRKQMTVSYNRSLFFLIIFTLLFTILAALSKENGLLLLAIVFLIEITFFRFSTLDKKDTHIILFFLFCLLMPTLLFLYYQLPILLSEIAYRHKEFNAQERLFTESRILWNYAYSILLPQLNQLGIFKEINLSQSLILPISTLYSVASWAIIIVSSILLIKKQNFQLVAFGLLFYLIAHSLESILIALELYFEHRNYLPSVGLFISVIAFLNTMLYKKYRILFYLFLTLYILINSFITYERSQIWSNKEQLIVHNALKHKSSYHAQIELVQLYTSKKRYNEAIEIVDNITIKHPKLTLGNNLHKIYIQCSIGDINNRNYIDLENNFNFFHPKYSIELLKAILSSYLKGKCPSLNIKKYANALSTAIEQHLLDKRYYWLIEYHIAESLLNAGEIDETIKHLTHIWKRSHKRYKSAILLLELLLMQENYKQAVIIYQQLKNKIVFLDDNQKKSFKNIEVFLKNNGY